MVYFTVMFTITALSCSFLESPLNGTIDCDRQTVEGTCTFSCDSTHTLRGSDSRSCLTSQLWSGRPAICDPPLCPDLTPPENGFIVFPCTREAKTTCNLLCFPGYALRGPSEQTCVMQNELVWTDPPTCEGMLLVPTMHAHLICLQLCTSYHYRFRIINPHACVKVILVGLSVCVPIHETQTKKILTYCTW